MTAARAIVRAHTPPPSKQCALCGQYEADVELDVDPADRAIAIIRAYRALPPVAGAWEDGWSRIDVQTGHLVAGVCFNVDGSYQAIVRRYRKPNDWVCFNTAAEARAWCDEQLRARGVILLKESIEP